MRDVYILENMAACKDFMSEHISKGYNEESFLGVGTFSSSVLKNSLEGAQIKVTPNFLKTDLIDYIVQGYLSLFDQEPILIQSNSNDSQHNISKWLLTGVHSAIFSLSNPNIIKHVNQFNLSSVEEYINNYFTFLIGKINEMRAQIVVILFDFEIFKNNLLKFYHWVYEEKQLNVQTYEHQVKKEFFFEKLIIKETLCFLSNAFFNNKIAIVPSRPELFTLFQNTIHEIRKESNLYSNDIVFRF